MQIAELFSDYIEIGSIGKFFFIFMNSEPTKTLRNTVVCGVPVPVALQCVLFCFSSLQTEAQKNAGVLLTQASTSQQSLLSQPVLLDVPVISGVEESRGTSEDPEDKDELEFPHDLLPSLDFTSDLNIWESSLG